jgi:hypothetical protein
VTLSPGARLFTRSSMAAAFVHLTYRFRGTGGAVAMAMSILLESAVDEGVPIPAFCFLRVPISIVSIPGRSIILQTLRTLGDQLTPMRASPKRGRVNPWRCGVWRMNLPVNWRRNSSQVVGVSTDPVSTDMIEFKPFGDRSMVVLPHNSMDHNHLHRHTDLSVMATASPAGPVPTSSRKSRSLSLHEAG